MDIHPLVDLRLKSYVALKLKGKRASDAKVRGAELSSNPGQVVVAKAKQCPHCEEAIAATGQQLKEIYERIELP